MKMFKGIHFVTSDTEHRIPLSRGAGGEFKLTPGVKPNACSFMALYSYVERLGQFPGRVGSLQFFFQNDPFPKSGPPTPDFEIREMRIVDLVPGKIAKLKGSDILRPIEYQIVLADRREAFEAPRGGVLTHGSLNKEPFQFNGAQDANLRTTITFKEAVEYCLDAMALNITVPHSFSDMPQPLNLEWHGSHAPTELAKLLDTAGYAFILKIDGTMGIDRIGSGSEPDKPKLQSGGELWDHIAEVSVPKVDRRGAIVVFSSLPNPVFNTITLRGPANYLNPTPADADLEYVFFDPYNRRFVTYPEAAKTFLQGANPMFVLRGQQTTTIAESVLELAKSSFFRCIRLNPAKYGRIPIMRLMVDDTGNSSLPNVKAQQTRLGDDGLYRNTSDKIEVHPEFLMEGGTVLVTRELLGCMESNDPQIDPYSKFRPLGGTELEIRITVEKSKEATTRNGDTVRVPEYFFAGFKQELGRISKLTQDELRIVLQNPETPIISTPELRTRQIDGVDQNRVKMEDKAAGYAPAYLRGSGNTFKIINVAGFWPFDCTGRVSEVTWSMDELSTTLRIDTWFVPHLDKTINFGFRRAKKREAGEQFPGQAESANHRSGNGSSGATQPAVSLMPPPVRRIEIPRLVDVTLAQVGGIQGTKDSPSTWTYDVFYRGTKVMAAATPEPGKANGRTTAATLGLAVYESDPTNPRWRLLIAFEKEGTTPCPS